MTVLRKEGGGGSLRHVMTFLRTGEGRRLSSPRYDINLRIKEEALFATL